MKIESTIDPPSGPFQANRAAKYVRRHKERGKLLPRERVEPLLAERSHFLELAPPARKI